MTRIVTIDPGKRNCGLASWSPDGTLLMARLASCDHEPGTERAQMWKDMASWVKLLAHLDSGEEIILVSEIPQVYEGPQDEDRNDLIDLAGVVGAITASIVVGHVEWSPTPREWKGQLPKKISRNRVDAKLSDAEKALIIWPRKDLVHNVYDALHLGLTYFEREGIRLPRS